jgi:soluble lytic murein transglycosylase-like protein
MGVAPSYVFPGALLGSVVLALFTFMVTTGLSMPAGQTATALQQSQPEGDNAELSPGELLAQQMESQPLEEQPAEETDEQTTDCGVSENYPDDIRQWCELITHFSDKNKLDPDLIAALIWQESGGNPTAYSRSGAVGLMQVMPRDGLAANFMCPNGPCFTNRPSIAELQDAKFNVRYGTGMLAGLQGKYGNIRDALKYYGPKDVGYYYADKVLGIFESYKR